MRWTKTKYELTIGEVGLMLETNDPAILKRYKLTPGFIARRAMVRFIIEFAEMFNSRQLDQLIDNDIFMAKIRGKVQMLTLLYNGLLNEMTFGVDDPVFKDTYREIFGIDFPGQEGLDRIIKMVTKLTDDYRVTATAKPKSEQSRMSFAEIVANTEMMLERSLPRDLPLYEFKHEFDLAVARAREFEKIKNKSNG